MNCVAQRLYDVLGGIICRLPIGEIEACRTDAQLASNDAFSPRRGHVCVLSHSLEFAFHFSLNHVVQRFPQPLLQCFRHRRSTA